MNTKVAFFIVALCAAQAAIGNELVITSEKAGRAQAAALDFVSDGSASALQVRFRVPGETKVSVNTAKCTSGLPKTHSGECRFDAAKGVVTVIIYSDTNALLPAGVVSIGTISVTDASGPLAISELLAFNASAQEIKIGSQGDSGVNVAK